MASLSVVTFQRNRLSRYAPYDGDRLREKYNVILGTMNDVEYRCCPYLLFILAPFSRAYQYMTGGNANYWLDQKMRRSMN